MLKRNLLLLIVIFNFPLIAAGQGTRAAIVIIPQVDNLRGEGILINDVENSINEYFGKTAGIISPKDLAVSKVDPAVEQNAHRALKRAENLFVEGRKIYDNLDMMNAIRKFVEARAIFFENILYLDDHTPLALTLFYLGLISGTMNDEQSQMSYFSELMLIDENYRPDPALCPPRVLQQIAKAGENLKGKQAVYASFSSNPSGAEVKLNGKNIGVTPMEGIKIFLTGPTGDEHAFSISKRGFHTFRGWLNLKQQSPSIMVNLKPINQRNYLTELTSLFNAPNTRGNTIRVATDLVNETRAREAYLWTIHQLGDKYLLVVGKVDRIRPKVVAGNINPEIPGNIQQAVKNIFAYLNRPGGNPFEVVGDTDIPEKSGLDFKTSFLGYFKASSFMGMGDTGKNYYEEGEKNKWYNNKWTWIGTGAGLLAIGGGVALYFLLSGDNGGTPEPVIKNQVTVTGTIK